MIVTELNGGLGNQMFQYAIGRALALKHETELRLDTSSFEKYPLRSFALGNFAISSTELSRNERAAIRLKSTPLNRADAFFDRIFGRVSLVLIREKGFEYDPSVARSPQMAYLRGYWQSPKYFEHVGSEIRKEFVVRHSFSERSNEIAEQMAACIPVSLHVRRGDYVSNPKTNRYHGTCDAEYYSAAEALIRARIGEFHLFVFSDDPKWAAENLRFKSPATFLGHNGADTDYDDLRLMTHCRHHILANSTFSWWGAWLCERTDKIVIAPRNWFKEANLSTVDLIPADWIRI